METQVKQGDRVTLKNGKEGTVINLNAFDVEGIPFESGMYVEIDKNENKEHWYAELSQIQQSDLPKDVNT